MATKMVVLRNSGIVDMVQVLQKTDGESDVIQTFGDDGKLQKQEFKRTERYSLTPEAEWCIAVNHVALKRVADLIESKRAEIIRRHTKSDEHPDGQDGIQPSHPKHGAAVSEIQELFAQETDVRLHVIRLENVHRSKTHDGKLIPEEKLLRLPPTILARMVPFVEDGEAGEKDEG